jgi:putative transposase
MDHAAMPESQLNWSEIAFILRPVEEGTALTQVCRKAGISEATFYDWRKKYGA